MSQLASEVDDLSFERYLTDPSIDPPSEWGGGQAVPRHAVADRHDAMVGWLIDPDGGAARFDQLDQLGPDGRYREHPGEAGRYCCTVLPLVELGTRWLAQRPLPKTLAILRGWGVI